MGLSLGQENTVFGGMLTGLDVALIEGDVTQNPCPMDLTNLIITWLIMSASFFILSKLPLGVEIDSLGTALISAAVFGILNAFIKPIFEVLGFPLVVITLGLFIVVINAAIFGLAAWLVRGFYLRWGIWSALLGSIVLGLINSVFSHLLSL